MRQNTVLLYRVFIYLYKMSVILHRYIRIQSDLNQYTHYLVFIKNSHIRKDND